MTNELKEYFSKYASMTENWLHTYVGSYSEFTKGLTEGMRYSLLNGGKRLRPVLMFASGDIFGADSGCILPYAASVEMLHTYSLIHDDLPAMDNDDLRRGVPTNHKKFGEAEAILAGDALLTKAFEVIADDRFTCKIDGKTRLAAVLKLACAAGDKGMVAGQFADIINEKMSANGKTLDFIHKHKTGALIAYCAYIGALIGGGGEKEQNEMWEFGEKLGIAFQITDDILDVTSSPEVLGKSVHKDENADKLTYPAMYGIDNSRMKAETMIFDCLDILEKYGEDADIMRGITRFVLERES